MNPDLTPAERAAEIVAKLFLPDNPSRWGESPVSVEELTAMIAAALAQERERALAPIADIIARLNKMKFDHAEQSHEAVWRAIDEIEALARDGGKG